MVQATEAVEELLTAGEAALLAGVSADTIRYWEKIGRLHLAARSRRGVRLFTGADLQRALERNAPRAAAR